MENNRDIGVRTTFDARLHFTRLLVKIIEDIASNINEVNPMLWEVKLRNYYSITHKYLSGKDKTLILKQFEEINKLKRRRSQMSYYNKVELYTTEAPSKLLELQNNLFEKTSHLLLPTQEVDLNDEFNEKDLLGL